MLVEKYIDHEIPVLKSSDTIRIAIKKFEESNLDQLPVVDDDVFQGILLRETVESVIDPKGKLEGIRLFGKASEITASTHALEALRIAHDSQLQVVGVLENDKKKFLGAIKKTSLLAFFEQSYAVKTVGSVLVLNVLERDYSMHEISRLVEANGAKILGALTEVREDDPYSLIVNLKLNLSDLSRVIAALQRHNYNVVYSFHREEYENKDKERLEHLLRFLEI